MSHESKVTTNHDEIRKWVEARGGVPAAVKSTENPEDVGVLRIHYPGHEDETFDQISWEEFFEKFEEKKLAFVYQEEKAGGETSRFSKFVNRDNV